MYINRLKGLSCGCKQAFFGLADGSSSATATATTQTAVNTQVSPNISPNFIQQQQPTNSAVNASTSQSLPNMPGIPPSIMSPNYPTTGAIPYFDTGANIQSTQPSFASSLGMSSQILTYGAIALVAFAMLPKKHHVS